MDSFGGKERRMKSTAKMETMGRGVMQKKFKIDDGTNAFVEMNTLLEPSNNATAQMNE